MTTTKKASRKGSRSPAKRRSKTIGRTTITLSTGHRGPNGNAGRFGGGWQYCIGAQWTTRYTIILNLLVAQVRISTVRKAVSA